MKTIYDLVGIIYTVLYNSAVKTNVSGDIYKFDRPTGSVQEDVVINGLAINNEQLQSALLNVNIHVPNLRISAGGIQDSVINSARLKELTDLAIGVLDDSWDQEYTFSVQQQTVIQDIVTGEYYSNIRIEFISINLN